MRTGRFLYALLSTQCDRDRAGEIGKVGKRFVVLVGWDRAVHYEGGAQAIKREALPYVDERHRALVIAQEVAVRHDGTIRRSLGQLDIGDGDIGPRFAARFQV